MMFRVGGVRLQGLLDLYNLFNSSWPYTVSSTYSTAASSPLPPRTRKCSSFG